MRVVIILQPFHMQASEILKIEIKLMKIIVVEKNCFGKVNEQTNNAKKYAFFL